MRATDVFVFDAAPNNRRTFELQIQRLAGKNVQIDLEVGNRRRQLVDLAVRELNRNRCGDDRRARIDRLAPMYKLARDARLAGCTISVDLAWLRGNRADTVPGVTEDGFLERARELAPNFEFTTYAPEARRDQDGVLEIVLKTEVIGRKELIYAAKLFALVHQIGRLFFEGKRLPTIAPLS